MAVYEVDPISRIEGHLGVKATTSGTGAAARITEADAHGNLWRGFENFLIGRDVNDAITFTQRICGVCPIPHATASTFAADSVLGYSDGMITFQTGAQASAGVPAKAVLIRNIVYASEFVMSAITHFYHLAALSYVQGPPIPPWTPHYNDSQYHALLLNTGHGVEGSSVALGATALSGVGILPAINSGTAFSAITSTGIAGFSKDLWSAVIRQYVKALRIRRLTFEAGAMFAGRMPMTSSFVAGGVTNTVETDASMQKKCDLFYTMFSEIGSFVAREYVPLACALGLLYHDYDNDQNVVSVDNTGTVQTNTSGKNYGAGCKNLLAWGAFPNVDNNISGLAGGHGTDQVTIQGGYYIGNPVSGSAMAAPKIFMVDATSALTAISGVAPSGAVALVKDRLREYIARSNYVASTNWGYASSGTPYAYPGAVTRTEPDRTTAGKYTWLKAPRWKGDDGNWYPMEVGPFARLVVNGIYDSINNGYVVGPLAGVYGGTGPTSGKVYLNAQAIHPDLASALIASGLVDTTGTETVVAGTGSGDSARFTSGHIGGAIATALYPSGLGIKCGFSTMDRLRARAIESFLICQWLIGAFQPAQAWNSSATPGGWVGSLRSMGTASGYTKQAPISASTTKSGFGVSEAPRGALAHFVTVTGTKINAYQCVVPTTWNASPKDGSGTVTSDNKSATKRGPMEQAMIGVPFDDSAGTKVGTAMSGIEVLRIAQSFDPCIACSVH